jgi:hypothetical protein
MKTATTALLCILIIFAPAASWAISIDASNAGVEVTAPNEVIFHNLLKNADGTYLYGVFRWSPLLNIWYPIEAGPEEPTFKTYHYWPMAQGNSWTYTMAYQGIPYGGTYTLTVDGTADICGQPSLVLLDTGGTVTYWINDETGVWMTRYMNPDGTYTDYCPAMKIAPAQIYPGSQSFNPSDGTFYLPGGSGTLRGWSIFVVKGLEDVTVPAGTFPNCLRATFNYSYTNLSDGSFGVRTEETWHAAGVGIVKRVNAETYGWDGMIFFSKNRVDSLISYTVSE